MKWVFLFCILMPEITLHARQQQAIYSLKRIVIMCSGIQGGKTTSGAIWMRKRVSTVTDSNTNFLVTSPTVKIFNQSTEPAFLTMFHGLGKYNKSEHIFEMNRKRKVFLRSMHEVDSAEGMTNVEGVWGDEIGKYKRQAWTNLEGRSAFRQCPIFGTTTPYALNWLWKDIYKPWLEGRRDDVDFIQFASIENPYFSKAEFERQKRLLDPRVFAMKYEGKFERMAGLVYPDIDSIHNFEEPFSPNKRDYFLVGGVDFGFQNKFAIVLRALHRKEKRDYQVGEYYRSGMLLDDITAIMLKMQNNLGIELFYADSSEPRTIADLQARGIRIQPVKKGPGSIEYGVGIHRELLKTREHKLFRGKCPNTEDEYATYHYPEDDGPEKALSEAPVPENNHLCFSAGTMIEALGGSKPIESVLVGDFVLTRDGFQRVLASGMTSKDENVWQYEVAGVKIEATPKHPIFTANRGFVAFCELTGSDTIYMLSSWLKVSNGTGTSTEDTRKQSEGQIGTISKEPLLAGPLTYTAMCGNFIMGRFRKECSSTMSTAIRAITGLKILLSQIVALILNTTNPNQSFLGMAGATGTLQKSAHSQSLGTEAKRGASGTDNTPSQLGLLKEHSFAISAKPNILPISLLPDFVAVNARPKTSATGIKPVYNLTVENSSEFFANGMLVHNCDASRYVTMMTTEFRRERNEKAEYKPPKDDLDDLLSGDWASRVLGKKSEEDWYNEG